MIIIIFFNNIIIIIYIIIVIGLRFSFVIRYKAEPVLLEMNQDMFWLTAKRKS